MENHRLFAYGSLIPGQANAHIVEPIAGTWSRARVAGTLFEFHSGEEQGYRVLVLGGKDSWVDGWLLESVDLAAHWRRLDDFEGDAYQRVACCVRVSDGQGYEQEQRAFTYVLNASRPELHSQIRPW